MKAQTLFKLLALVLSLTIGLAIAEAGARAVGQQPWIVKDPGIRIEPGGRLFQTNRTVGYRNLPGEFRFTLPTGYQFSATLGADTLRITEAPEATPPDDTRPQIWLFGGSYVFGWGLENDETFAWLLQQKYPQYKVLNFGVSGYGSVNALLQFENALEERGAPEIAVLTYAGFHDMRNSMLRLRAKAIVPFSKVMGDRWRPFARIDADGKLEITIDDIQYQPVPLMDKIALVHSFEKLYNRLEEYFYDSREISRVTIHEMAGVAERAGVSFVVGAITPDALEFMDLLRQQGLHAGDMAIDDKDPAYNLKPDDGHPNQLSNRIYATKLTTLLDGLPRAPAHE